MPGTANASGPTSIRKIPPDPYGLGGSALKASNFRKQDASEKELRGLLGRPKCPKNLAGDNGIQHATPDTPASVKLRQQHLSFKGLAIRAYGKDHQNIVHLFVIDMKTGDKLCNFRVKEGLQNVELRGNAGSLLLTTTNGLFCFTEKMCVRWSDGKHLADISNNGIRPIEKPYPVERWFLTQVNHAGFIRYQLSLNQKQRGLSLIHQDYNCVALVSVRRSDNLTRSLMLLVALKLYYSAYFLHQQTMPTGVLSTENMPEQRSSLASLSVFVGTILRAAFKGEPSEYFIEALCPMTGNVHFVIWKYGTKIEVKDTYRRVLFIVSDIESDTVKILYRGDIIGWFRKGSSGDREYYDASHPQNPVMISQTTKAKESPLTAPGPMNCEQSHLKQFEIFPSQYTESSAVISPCDYTVALSITGVHLETKHKALLLASAAQLALYYYQLHVQHLPKVDAYPYKGR